MAGAQFRVFERGVTNHGAVLQSLIFRSRQRADGFSKQAEVLDLQRHFSTLSAEHDALRLDEVANIQHPVEKLDPLLAKLIHAQE